jgi:hypothetical protein
MAYLDEDILYNNVEEKYKSAKGEARAAYSDVLDTICEMPRADVAPKSEVAMEIFAEIEKIRTKEIHKCETMREKEYTHTQRNYWEGGEHALRQLSYWIAELKKKYTEGKE